jgi:hypothetical protein
MRYCILLMASGLTMIEYGIEGVIMLCLGVIYIDIHK